MPLHGFAPGLYPLNGELPNFDYALSAFIITAARTPQVPDHVAHTVTNLRVDALRAAPTATLDGLLRSVPGFSLFRRSDSLTANPTAQGVSLRGLGPSGASRSLLLLDGVPLNDPFGGWVAWTKVPREGLGRVELIPGGGATAWGNASLGGVVQLFTLPARGEPMVARAPVPPGSPPYTEGKLVWGSRATLRFDARLGDFGTRSAEFDAVYPTVLGTLQLLGRDFSTDGFSLVAPERRGPIDVAAWSRHRWLTARWRQPVGQKMELLATARSFEEFRGNGTPYTRNGSREKFASLALAGQPAENFGWEGVAYAQDQSFASTFSSVNATRTAETPASDQFAVPATAFGSAWTGSWKNSRSPPAISHASALPAGSRRLPVSSRCTSVRWCRSCCAPRSARGSTRGAKPTVIAARPTATPAPCCATTTTPTATAPSSAPAPAWCGRPRRSGACGQTRNRPSACRR